MILSSRRNRNIRLILILTFFLFAIPEVSSAQQAQQRPNFLWIICEDVTSSFFPMYGDSTILTPNLSRLADQGITFTRMFSTYGVCAPSRSSIITGMYPESIGAMDMRTTTAHSYTSVPGLVDYQVVPPPGIKCFTEYLRAAGYYCANNGKTDYQFKSPITAWDENKEAGSWGENRDKAVWENRKRGQPFFAVYNLFVTHESQIWKKEDKPLRVDPQKVPVPPYYPQHDTVIRKDIARNYDNIMVMDKRVGDLISNLKRDHLLDNTIIIFCSDHGGPIAGYKYEAYDRGTHIPFIVRFPDGQRAGTKDTELHSLVDMAPTILSLAGLSIPEHLQGQAFLGTRKANQPRKYIYTARDRMGNTYDLIRTVRSKRYQYIRNYDPDLPHFHLFTYTLHMAMAREIKRLKNEDRLNKPLKHWFSPKQVEELYDIKEDPYELHNLADNAAYSAVLKRMRQTLHDWERETRDKGFMQERDLINLMWPGLKQPVTQTPVIRTIGNNRIGDIIKITCTTDGASIAYHLNSDKEDYWHLYSHPITLPAGESIRAKAIRIGFKESNEKVYSNN